MSPIKTNLYDFQCYFALIVNNVLTEILEPDGWNQIRLHSPRDPQSWGFMTDFIDDKLGALFTYASGSTYPGQKNITGGAEILYNLYETIGSEAEVYFQFGQKVSNSYNPLYTGKINLNVYHREYPGGVSSSIEKMPLQATFLARKSAPVTVNNAQNFDLDKLTPITTNTVRLHSQALQETTSAVNPTPEVSDLQQDGGGNLQGYQYVIQPDTNIQNPTELQTCTAEPLGIINNVPGTPSVIYGLGLYQYQAQYAGTLNINYSGFTRFWFFQSVLWVANLYTEVVQMRMVNGVYQTLQTWTGAVTQVSPLDVPLTGSNWGTNIIPAVSYPGLPGPGPGAPSYIMLGTSYIPVVRDNIYGYGDTPYSWNVDLTNIIVEPLDQFYVHLRFDMTASSLPHTLYYMQLDQYQNTLSFTQVTLAPATTANGYRIFDILNQQLECCSGQVNALKSSYFSPGGAGYNYLLANGFAIRSFLGNAYSFRKDLESLLSDLQAIFCIGWGFSVIDGVEYLVVEHISHFLNPNNIILYIGNSYGWYDTHGAKYVYNQAQLGYSNYAKDELQMLYAFCTDANYLLQTSRTLTNVLQAKSGLVADGNTLEFARRQQFQQNAGNDNNFDDNIFIVAVLGNNSYADVPVTYIGNADISPSGGNLSILFPYNLSLVRGDRISVTSGIFAGSTFTVYNQLQGYPNTSGTDGYQFIDNIPVATYTDVINFTLVPVSPNILYAESNEPFAICNNILDPGAIYNGRISNKHILYNWNPVLSVSLYFQSINPSPALDYNQIQTTQTKNNRLFTTQFKASEPNKGYAGELVLTEIANTNYSDYLQNAAIFTPKGGSCKAPLGWNEYNLLKAALAQETGNPSLDGGGIVVNDDLGNFWFCHITDVLYDPVEQIAEFQLQKVRRYFPTAGEITM